MFDYDQDGVVSMKEGQGMLRCLGLATDAGRWKLIKVKSHSHEMKNQAFFVKWILLVTIHKTSLICHFSVKTQQLIKIQNCNMR